MASARVVGVADEMRGHEYGEHLDPWHQPEFSAAAVSDRA
jgi:hypothetical protein